MVAIFAWTFRILIPFTIIPGCIGAGALMVVYLLSKYFRPRSFLYAFLSIGILSTIAYIKYGQPASLTHNVMADWRVLNSFSDRSPPLVSRFCRIIG
jgi:hypothetical protein